MRSRDLVDAWKKRISFRERTWPSRPGRTFILPALSGPEARSQKDRSVRLQQILEENQQKEG